MKPRRTGKARALAERTATGSGQMELPGISDPPRARQLKPPAAISGFALTAIPDEPVRPESADGHGERAHRPGHE
jgi:hypothetical protein